MTPWMLFAINEMTLKNPKRKNFKLRCNRGKQSSKPVFTHF